MQELSLDELNECRNIQVLDSFSLSTIHKKIHKKIAKKLSLFIFFSLTFESYSWRKPLASVCGCRRSNWTTTGNRPRWMGPSWDLGCSWWSGWWSGGKRLDRWAIGRQAIRWWVIEMNNRASDRRIGGDFVDERRQNPHAKSESSPCRPISRIQKFQSLRIPWAFRWWIWRGK